MSGKSNKSNYNHRLTRAEREAEARARAKKQKIIGTAVPVAVIALLIGLILILGFTMGGWGQDGGYTPTATYHAAIEIENYGTIHLELYGNDAPISVANFIDLAQKGYYNGSSFHRIINGFMMQGGSASPSTDVVAKSIKGEFKANGVDNKIAHTRGVLSMARAGNEYSGFDTGSSEFFIVHQTSPHLDGQYAAFGMVTSGMDIVDRICSSAQPINNNGGIAVADRPIIKSITVHPIH